MSKGKRRWTDKVKSWWLGVTIRNGVVPRGRTSKEVIDAIGFTQKGICGEIWGVLSAKVIRKDGTVEDKGVLSVKKITTAFRDYIVDSLQDSSTYPLDAFKYHDSGTDNTADANTQTALGTPTGVARSTGTQIEGATADIYKSVATITYDGTYAVVEHGLFSASSAGTMMDRSVFSALNMTEDDSIQFTYEGTFNAEA